MWSRGPATDNRVGTRFVESLGVPASNARTNAKEFGRSGPGQNSAASGAARRMKIDADYFRRERLRRRRIALLAFAASECGEHSRDFAQSARSQDFADAHPNLRGVVEGKFESEITPDAVKRQQLVVFSALPHGELAKTFPSWNAWTNAGIADDFC